MPFVTAASLTPLNFTFYLPHMVLDVLTLKIAHNQFNLESKAQLWLYTKAPAKWRSVNRKKYYLAIVVQQVIFKSKSHNNFNQANPCLLITADGPS